jgi:ATP-dependent helicase/nuclease subunit B
VTRPRDLLRISYAVGDESSKALAPSPYLAHVLGAVDEIVVERAADPVETRGLWNIGTAGALSARLGLELVRRGAPADDPDDQRGRWNALYNWARREAGCRGSLGRALAALKTPEETGLDAAAIGALYGESRPWSVSQLESAAVCPFRHFAGYGLGLRERDEFKLDALDLGQLHHRILEQLLGQLIADGVNLRDIRDDELQTRLLGALDAETDKLDEELLLEHARRRYLHDRSAQDLRRATQAQRQLGAAGNFQPRAIEVPFGFDDRDDSLPALEIDTPGGRTVRIRGFIDRVDLAQDDAGLLAMIVDYKRAAERKLNLAAVLAGLELQLLTYLLVVREHGAHLFADPATPAGAFYFNIKPRYETVDHPSQAKAAQGGVSKIYQPRGVLNVNHARALDKNLHAGVASNVFNVQFKKDGTLGYAERSDALNPDQLESLLNVARQRLGTLADQVLDGNVQVRPAHLSTRSLPCNWCAFGTVCRFEPATGRAHAIEEITRSAALAGLG